MPNDYDIIVADGGIAGTAVAVSVTRDEIRVLLTDEGIAWMGRHR